MTVLLGRTRLRSAPWIVSASALVLLGCFGKDAPDLASTQATTAPSENTSGEEGERSEDPAVRARIELLTEDAVATLRSAANFLADQQSFRFVADISFDVEQRDGRTLEFGGRSEYTVRRPDRVRMREARRDGDSRALYFDGTTISVDLPGHGAYVQIDRPGTLYAAIDHLLVDLDAPLPLAGLFAENLIVPIEDQILSGYFVGPADIDGRPCEQLAFRLPEVDVQLWIEEGERPLVARIVITHKLEDGNPQFRATLRDWELGAATPEALFRFEPEEGMERLRVESLLAERESASTPEETE